jgi:hypothetical protein
LKLVLITPPFTQLNTPYPATMYLKGFLNTLGCTSYQCDLGLETILAMFCKDGLSKLFDLVEQQELPLTDRAYRIFTQRKAYIQTIDAVVRFLQNKDQTLATAICAGNFLPEGSRFEYIIDVDWAFGHMGLHDKARHLCTLYIEDLGDFITDTVDEHFGFSRYAERIARTATHFEDIELTLQSQPSYVMREMLDLLAPIIEHQQPDLVVITAPFPGNVIGAFTCGQFIKTHFPSIKIALGGGYVNTELRSVYDERVFKYIDFITLDDGEAPLTHLIQHLEGERSLDKLKRTFCLVGGVVSYIDGSQEFDVPQAEVGTPDYSDLQLDRYLSVIEVVNPMHKLWSDGRWNKLTLAHGCYWGKCSFCDVTLDYIKRYEPVTAAIICDRIEAIISQTGERGFHFVDEAAPPALMRDVALEIIRRGIIVTWWTNIRFEKSFTADLCKLLRRSGCIAVSGGLEVASDRLLTMMKKGVTVAQVAQVAKAFEDAGIMVHAYLMYGFPTQTPQETIDSLEMVRQMFQLGILRSGFWHQFAMTAHSPVGLNPSAYEVVHDGPIFGGFAENDYFHLDEKGAIHEAFSEGLRISLFNYMQGEGFDLPLRDWFDHKVPKTSIPNDYIERALKELPFSLSKDTDQVVWIGGHAIQLIEEDDDRAELVISGLRENSSLFLPMDVATWLVDWIEKSHVNSRVSIPKYADLKLSIKEDIDLDVDEFVGSEIFDQIRQRGLLIL